MRCFLERARRLKIIPVPVDHPVHVAFTQLYQLRSHSCTGRTYLSQPKCRVQSGISDLESETNPADASPPTPPRLERAPHTGAQEVSYPKLSVSIYIYSSWKGKWVDNPLWGWQPVLHSDFLDTAVIYAQLMGGWRKLHYYQLWPFFQIK